MAFQQDSMGIDQLNLGLIHHLDSGSMPLGFSCGLAGAPSLCFTAPKLGFQIDKFGFKFAVLSGQKALPKWSLVLKACILGYFSMKT